MLGRSLALDVHEINFRVIEEEMIVQRGYAQTVFECDGHSRIDFVFEQNGVTHHHRPIFCLGERGPGTESHERRHRPAIDSDLHIRAREGYFINAFLLIELAL